MIVFPDIKVLLRKFIIWTHFVSISSCWIALYSQVYGVDDMILAPAYLRVFFVLRCLRTFRVLRIFHIIRGWDVLVLALRDSMWEITVLAVLFVTGMIIFSSLMFYAEYSNPESFPGIPIGLWWAIVTMKTVGYGDFYPTTSYGYVVGAVCAITGMFATSLPIPIISENFSKMRHGQRLLDDYKHDSRMTIDPLDKRKGVFVCPVCYTRSFLDHTLEWYLENSLPDPPTCSHLRSHTYYPWLPYSAPSHCLNQWWVIVNWTLRNKLHGNFIFSFQKLLLKMSSAKTAAIWHRVRWVKLRCIHVMAVYVAKHPND